MTRAIPYCIPKLGGGGEGGNIDNLVGVTTSRTDDSNHVPLVGQVPVADHMCKV